MNNPKQNRGRHRNNARRSNPSRQNFDSNGPGVRIRGNATQVYEKYIQLARDAQGAGDRVMAENMLQHAEHYFRILNENSNGERPRLSTDEPSYDQTYTDDQSDEDGGEDGDDLEGNTGSNANAPVGNGYNGGGYGNSGQNGGGQNAGGQNTGGQNTGGRNGPRNGPNRGRGRRPQNNGGGNSDGNRAVEADGNSNGRSAVAEQQDTSRPSRRQDEVRIDPVVSAPEPAVETVEEVPRPRRGRPRGPARIKADPAAAGETPAQQEFSITVD